jgi:hypothetical protein
MFSTTFCGEANMCGLFGVAGLHITQKDIKYFNELGQLNDMYRGGDGIGVFEVNSRYPATTEKVRKTQWDYLQLLKENKDEKNWRNKVLENISCDFIMGHARYATTGGWGLKSCHPFIYPKLVGMHNGTLKANRFVQKGAVDSDLMFQAMNEEGIRPVLESLTPECAFAITMYDRESRNFVFALNGKRPLQFALHKDRQVLYWASEWSTLKFVLSLRYGENVEYFHLNPGLYYTNRDLIKFGDNIFRGEPTPLPEYQPVERPVQVQGTLLLDEKEPKRKDVPDIKASAPVARKTNPKPYSDLITYTKCCNKPLTPVMKYEMEELWEGGWYDSGENAYYCYPAECDACDKLIATH